MKNNATKRGLPYGVSRYYRSLSRWTDPAVDPIAAQFEPREEEESRLHYESDDPIGDTQYAVTGRLIHHYRDRVLLLVSDRCATYCRHCFRRHFTGNSTGRITHTELEAAISYIREHGEVQEVLLSGGDPLMLGDRELGEILSRLRALREDLVFRVCSRVPVVLPGRITEPLAELLGSYAPLWFVTHANHPGEITEQFRRAIERLRRHGTVTMNQSVLLRGVNDDPDTLERLFRQLLRAGVKPYYLFQGDLAAGTAHFRVPIERGIEIMQTLRSRLSGMALPTYAVDLPEGGGKVPVESHLLRIEKDWYVFRGPQGSEYRYPREV
ncbi:MAG: KamA family radical SAM protein [Alkalispirochaetaceae bacterium]